MCPCSCALILAVTNPSSVATASCTTGMSRGVTVVTSTSGGGGATCSALREQPLAIPSSRAAAMRSVLVRTFILFNLSSLRAYIELRPYVSSLRSRRCNGFFHMAFRLLWQWTHPAAWQEPDTRILTRTVEYDCPFLRDCTIKACLRMRLDHADEILLPWIAFKVRELFNNLAQLSDAHALQRF